MRTLSALSKLFFCTMLLLTYGQIANSDDNAGPDHKWVEKGYRIDGGWNIVEKDGKNVLTFSEDFSTKKGPDLKVYLSKESIQKIKGRNVTKTSILISALKSEKGAQEYQLPDDLNLDDFSSVLIHCEAYSHLWGGGALKNTN